MDREYEYIEKIKDVLSEYKSIDYAFLFGSILEKALPESDVDILIGAYLEPSKKADLAMKLALALRRKVDVVLQKEAPCEVVLKAFSKGKPVLVNDKNRLKKDYLRNFYLYEDTNSLRRLRISRIKRRHGYGG